MILVKILKRRDAASVIVAVVLGFLLVQLVSVLAMRLTAYLSGADGQLGGFSAQGIGWRVEYLQPVVGFVLAVVLLELLALLYVTAVRVISDRQPARSKRK